ncbi:hypothetical protein ACFO6V_28000 [Promicromonospora alba]|uniref:Gp6-like head-tail connector protein n=1 Tax=Promicromonospora alba TaxID=1616110 RepID=A0ABV9HPQ2_9MICO
MAWNDIGSALITEVWADAPTFNVNALTAYLEAAHTQCVAYAPALVDDADIPQSYLLAEIMQARALANSMTAGTADQFGDGFAVTVYPMDWNVKNLLRPKTQIRFH